MTERKIFVEEIAEQSSQDTNQDVGNHRVDVQDFDKDLQAAIHHEKVAHRDDEIAHNLHDAFQIRLYESDVALQPKATEEDHGPFEHQGSDVRREGDKTQIPDFAFEDKFVNQIVQKPIEDEHHATHETIAEKLDAEVFLERRIKEIDEFPYPALYFLFQAIGHNVSLMLQR